jgi:hypothetical protein
MSTQSFDAYFNRILHNNNNKNKTNNESNNDNVRKTIQPRKLTQIVICQE